MTSHKMCNPKKIKGTKFSVMSFIYQSHDEIIGDKKNVYCQHQHLLLNHRHNMILLSNQSLETLTPFGNPSHINICTICSLGDILWQN